MQRRQGFTALELLVVVAIVGLLSAMLFPAFARARQETRQASCLANVQTVARALRMYASDYDGKLLPSEQDPTVHEYFTGVGCTLNPGCCDNNTLANPYLRPAVVLDPYLSSRSTWRCPQARSSVAAEWILPVSPDHYWFDTYLAVRSYWCPCSPAWPLGWGGTITDASQQCDDLDLAVGNSTQSLATSECLVDLSLSQVAAPGRFLTVGDGGNVAQFRDVTTLAFPDWCRTSGATSSPCGADWANCPESRSCGLDANVKARLVSDRNYRLAFTRHHGGSNVGFLDGHATWVSANLLLTRTTPFRFPLFTGACSHWPGSGAF
jgi:prepilin-type N-terminal cleavage/methylation domain-containing protein/prepilin-type processing-associated H-X9-DG protein